ncbi:MAG: phosphopyruvate hydratase [Candidatus Berkelbacteria bacterium]
MAIIKDLRGREILDSRGNPTVACEVILDDGTYAVGYSPSGVTVGAGEALELRDKDPLRYEGMGVLKAVGNINSTIRTALLGMDIGDLARIDQKMIFIDATPNKARLGANATLAVSLACAKAGAKTKRIPLYKYLSEIMGKNADTLTMPIPFMNILNGGKHAVGSTDFQEFMIVPVNFQNVREALRAGSEIFHALGKILKERNYQPLVGDEGGFAPSLFSNEQALELLMMAISEADYEAGKDVFIALDPAASRFYSEEGFYELYRENKTLTNTQLVDYYLMICEKYPIISIEDPLAHNDWHGWRDLTQKLGDKIEIIGDDIYSTNFELLKKGIAEKSSTGILIKPNQIGTLTETFNTIKTAEAAGFKVMISHRSGETEDSFIADLAIACGCGCIKAGAPCRSERTAKYNRLLEIEDKNLNHSTFAKWDTANNGGVTQL